MLEACQRDGSALHFACVPCPAVGKRMVVCKFYTASWIDRCFPFGFPLNQAQKWCLKKHARTHTHTLKCEYSTRRVLEDALRDDADCKIAAGTATTSVCSSVLWLNHALALMLFHAL